MADGDDWPENVRMPFGKHKDMTLFEIMQLGEEGCRYLDWMRDLQIQSDRLKSAYRQFMVRHRDEINRGLDDRE